MKYIIHPCFWLAVGDSSSWGMASRCKTFSTSPGSPPTSQLEMPCKRTNLEIQNCFDLRISQWNLEFGRTERLFFLLLLEKKISPGGTWSTSTQHLSSPRQPLSAASACTARVADFTVSGQRIPSMLTPWVQVTSCLACMERSRMIRTTRWWFQMFFIFNPGEMIQFD